MQLSCFLEGFHTRSHTEFTRRDRDIRTKRHEVRGWVYEQRVGIRYSTLQNAGDVACACRALGKWSIHGPSQLLAHLAKSYLAPILEQLEASNCYLTNIWALRIRMNFGAQ